MPMLYRVSNDVACKNTEALMLLRDFNLIVPSPAGDSRNIAPAVAEALEGLWLNDVLIIDQAAAAVHHHFDDFENAREIVRQAFLATMARPYHAAEGFFSLANMLIWGSPNNAELPNLDFDEETMSFNTALAHPFAVIRQLSFRFPDDIFAVTFAEENPGFNTGRYRIRNGHYLEYQRPADGSTAAYSLTRIHWGPDEDYVFEDARYQLRSLTEDATGTF